MFFGFTRLRPRLRIFRALSFLAEVIPKEQTVPAATLGDTRTYDGCIKVDVYEDENSSTITLFEEWETLAHQQKYLEWRIETGI